jgi:hypothetical protein
MQRLIRRDVDFGVISEAFELLTKHWQPFTLAGAIFIVAQLPSFVVTFLPLVSLFSGSDLPGSDPISAALLQYGLLFPAVLVAVFLSFGVTRFTLNVVTGQPTSKSDIWYGFKDIPGTLALSLLVIIVTLLGMVGCCIGVVVTGGLVMFAIPIKVATGANATRALAESWNMLKSQWLMVACFNLVVVLISQLGQMACYVGQAFTFSFEFIAATLLYCRFVGLGQPLVPVHSPYPRGDAERQAYAEPSAQEPAPPRPEDLS